MLKSRLDTIAATLDEELDVAVRLSAEAVAAAAKARVPVDSGDLRDAIHVERETDAYYRVVAGGEGVYYGHMVEHGSTKAPAQPFLNPAIESERDNFDNRVRAALGDL